MTNPAAIAPWLGQARWFAGKADGPVAVSIHDAAAVPGTDVSLALVDVAGTADRYVVPLVGDADGAIVAEFGDWIVRTALGGGTVRGRHGAFRGRPAGGTTAASLPPGAVTVAPLGGDASNTSLLVRIPGGDFAVKIIRRCRPGIQPEVEVGEFLATAAGWAGTPRFLGWLEYETSAGESAAVATVHAFAADCTTAWDHLVALVAGGGLTGRRRDEILEFVAALGRTTAGMHRALASRSDIAAFMPEPPSDDDERLEAARMVDHARRVFAIAAERLPALPPAVAVGVERFLQRGDEITARLGRFADRRARSAWTRIHGDYHLGQVLVRTPGPEILVIDFEGEPGRTLADRRRKTTPVKDVAGMCRSFDYLLRHAARGTAADYRAVDLTALETAYLTAYRDLAAGHDWWPREPATADEELMICKLDKAVYELGYELANRPDWVEVPLAALLS